MHADKLDKTDLKILAILQDRGRTKRNEIAEEVGLSIPSVSERLRKLESSGIIRSINAILEPEKVALQVTAFIFLMVESSKFYEGIIKHVKEETEIVECHAITGEGSHLLKVRTHKNATLEKLLSRIQAWPGVISTHTDVVLSSPKDITALPLQFVEQKK